jgi:Phytanoyl-CoA dioxygenase (PhyH)
MTPARNTHGIAVLKKPAAADDVARIVRDEGVVLIEGWVDRLACEALVQEQESIFKKGGTGIRAVDYEEGDVRVLIPRLARLADYPALQRSLFDTYLEDVSVKVLGTKSVFNSEVFCCLDQHIDKPRAVNILHFDKLRALKFFLYLTDTTADNGAFGCIPKSHLAAQERVRRHLEQGRALKDLKNRDLPNFSGKDVPVEGKAGSLIVFDSDVLHRAGDVKPGLIRRVIRTHCRLEPAPVYNPKPLTSQWFRESPLNVVGRLRRLSSHEAA